MVSKFAWALCAPAAIGLLAGVVHAQTGDEKKPEKQRNWTNSTDLSFVATEGNSNTVTLGFKDVYTYKWEHARFRYRIEWTRSDTADDPFLMVDSGVTWLPGETPTGPFSTTLVEPSIEPDVNIFFTEARYDKHIRDNFAWNVGASWDSNLDAGIESRSILFAGLTNVFWDKDDLKFNIAYGLSFTNREEESPDPLKDDKFAGLRFTWDYMNKFGKNTTYDFDFLSNVNLTDLADYTINTTNAISVAMSKKLALKFSMQWLYNNEPALEDVDVVAQVIVVDPDGIPGSGDEFFETVDSGGATVEIGEDQIRKDKLDTIFRTSLVINF